MRAGIDIGAKFSPDTADIDTGMCNESTSRHPPTRKAHVNANSHGFTLVELVIAMAVAALLYFIAVPIYSSFHVKALDARAIADISTLSAQIERYGSDNDGDLPGSLTDLGVSVPKDPWGHSYYYTPLQGTNANPSNARWDKNLKPINVDFDLYSAGPDGQSKQKITQQVSLDDIIRANGGAYVGLASDY